MGYFDRTRSDFSDLAFLNHMEHPTRPKFGEFPNSPLFKVIEDIPLKHDGAIARITMVAHGRSMISPDIFPSRIVCAPPSSQYYISIPRVPDFRIWRFRTLDKIIRVRNFQNSRAPRF